MGEGSAQVSQFTRQIFARIPTAEGGWLVVEKFTPVTHIYSSEGRGPSSYSAVEGQRDGDSEPDGSAKVCSYCCCGCLALLWAVINIYTIIIGVGERCPIEDGHIRAYLIVQGSFNLVQIGFCTLSTCAGAADKESTLVRILNCFNGFLMLFLIAWTITGSVWVWKSLGDWEDHHSLCNNTLFVGAIICLILHYVEILLLCCCSACMICMALAESDSVYQLTV